MLSSFSILAGLLVTVNLFNATLRCLLDMPSGRGVVFVQNVLSNRVLRRSKAAYTEEKVPVVRNPKTSPVSQGERTLPKLVHDVPI